MTTLSNSMSRSEFYQSIADDGTGNLATESEIQANIEGVFSQLGTLYTATGDIPSTATVRVAGEFTDAYDAMQWLDEGGLTAYDANGDLVPIGFVYFYEYYDSSIEDYIYQVWIDEETNAS